MQLPCPGDMPRHQLDSMSCQGPSASINPALKSPPIPHHGPPILPGPRIFLPLSGEVAIFSSDCSYSPIFAPGNMPLYSSSSTRSRRSAAMSRGIRNHEKSPCEKRPVDSSGWAIGLYVRAPDAGSGSRGGPGSGILRRRGAGGARVLLDSRPVSRRRVWSGQSPEWEN